jgi:hypothetical protein
VPDPPENVMESVPLPDAGVTGLGMTKDGVSI